LNNLRGMLENIFFFLFEEKKNERSSLQAFLFFENKTEGVDMDHVKVSARQLKFQGEALACETETQDSLRVHVRLLCYPRKAVNSFPCFFKREVDIYIGSKPVRLHVQVDYMYPCKYEEYLRVD
jgi:hypothetical protein